MMTEKQQRRFYFPAWNECARANDWVMVRGRLLADLVAQRQEFLKWPQVAADAGLSVLDYAEQLGLQEHRVVTAEDLRHGCNLVATAGRKQSSEALTNAELNRVVVLFRLLKEPEDLDAVMEWLHPDIADKRSLVGYLKRLAPEATLIAICRNAFGTIYWEGLDESKLRWLIKTVKEKNRSWRTSNSQRPTSKVEVEEPF